MENPLKEFIDILLSGDINKQYSRNRKKKYLDEYFTSLDKNGFSDEDSSNFWKAVQIIKFDNNDFEFDGFLFPAAKSAPFQNLKKKECNIIFENCSFQGDFTIGFSEIQDLILKNCTINGRFIIDDLKCENIRMENITSIGSSFEIADLTISGDLNIIESTFEGLFIIVSVKAVEIDIFNSSFTKLISKSADLLPPHKKNGRSPGPPHTFGSCTIENLSFYGSGLHLKHCEVSHKLNLFEEVGNDLKEIRITHLKANDTCILSINYSGRKRHPTIVFVDNEENNSLITFNQVNISLIQLDNLYLDRIKFKNCTVQRKYGRNLIFSDVNEDWYINNELPLVSDSRKEVIFRFLKTYFLKENNSYYSGGFYVSEMELFRKRLNYRENFFEKLIFNVYYHFSRYNHNFSRPLFILLFLIFILYPLVYATLTDLTILSAFQVSFGNALPLIKSDYVAANTTEWFLMRGQTFICSLNLAFVILALRKSFK